MTYFALLLKVLDVLSRLYARRYPEPSGSGARVTVPQQREA